MGSEESATGDRETRGETGGGGHAGAN